jgi:hypothetical protein
MATEKKPRTWVKDLLVAFAATTLSIILTFGTTMVVNHVKQKKERKLTALMVMSSIEQFVRDLEYIEKDTGHRDSIATWLLSIPIETLAKIDDEPLEEAFRVAINLPIITHDRTAETIFSSQIDTWKNMGNFKFVENVGKCFSEMSFIEEHFNERAEDIVTTSENIIFHPDDYQGNTMVEKRLCNEQVRRQLTLPHILRGWIRFYIADLRKVNRNNMRLIGITEKEVMDYTDDLGAADEYDDEELNLFDFDIPDIEMDSLVMHLSFARQVDSLMRVE